MQFLTQSQKFQYISTAYPPLLLLDLRLSHR